MNKTKIYGISIPICLVFVSLLINASHGQSPVNLLNYTNNDMKFTIQHPSNWQVKENTESPDGRVSFEPSDRSLPIFAVNTEQAAVNTEQAAVNTEQAERHLDSDKMTLKNISLEELAEHELNEMTSSVFRNFDLIKQNKVTVGGNDGWKMEFAGEDNFYLFEICTIANGKIYILTYQDYPSKVPETLPLANKMVDSFQIK